MSRLRQLLLRWRRRDEPVEPEETNVELLPIMHDPLKAIKTQLVIAAHRLREEEEQKQAAARRRRQALVRRHLRRGALVASMFVLVIAGAVTGAVAVGVDVSDGVLSALLADRQRPKEVKVPPSLNPPRDHAFVKPGPGHVSDALTVSWRGTPAVYVKAFISRANQVCFISAESPLPERSPRGLSGCISIKSVKGQLDDGIEITGIRAGELYTSVIGVTAADALAVGMEGPEGPLKTELSNVWSPSVAEPLGMRIFAGVRPAAPHRSFAEQDRILDRRRYELFLKLPGTARVFEALRSRGS